VEALFLVAGSYLLRVNKQTYPYRKAATGASFILQELCVPEPG
jgi:hypothetical protein